MTYEQLIEKVLAGRSVNATAKALGIPQKTLEAYVKATSFPGCSGAITLANAAGVSIEEAVQAIAIKSEQVRPRRNFSIPQLAPAALAILIGVTNYLTPDNANANEINALQTLKSEALYVM